MSDASTMKSGITLRDVGEFALLERVILPIVKNTGSIVSPLGDDCAFVCLPSGEHDLVITTDVGPRPLVWHLGHESYRTWGWYAVMVNASDLASAGATPLVITTSIDAAPTMLVDELQEFFEGVAEASTAHGLSNAGGNIRQAPRFACHATVIGYVPQGKQIRRVGARAGDLLVAIGDCGRFACAFLRAQRFGLEAVSAEDRERLCRPRAFVTEMKLLHDLGLITAASDASDGVLGALWNISEASSCGIRLDMTRERLPREVDEVAKEFEYDPWNLMFFWGDWQVIASVPAAKEAEFNRAIMEHNIASQILGRVIQGPPSLIGITDQGQRPLRLLRNENFVASSFNDDPLSNVDYMLRTPLMK